MPSVAKDFLDIIKDIRGTNFEVNGDPKEGFWFDVKTWHGEVDVDAQAVAADKATVAADKATVAADMATTEGYKDASLAAQIAAELAETNAETAATLAEGYRDTVVAKELLVNPHYTSIDWIGTYNTRVSGVYAIASNVTTVAGIAANVTTVANSNSSVTTVSANIADVSTTATAIEEVIAGGSTLNARIDLAIANATLAQEWSSKATDSLVDGVYYSARHYAAKAAADLVGSNSAATNALNNKNYAEEWANKDEGVLVSVSAGGNGVNEYSAKHYALAVATSVAAASDSAADAAASAVDSDASAVLADGYATTAEGHSTSASTSASTATTKAAEAVASRDVAWAWAQEAEDAGVNDGVNPAGFSAYHWSQKAAAIVGGITNFIDLGDTPGSYSGQSGKYLRVSAGNTIEFDSLTKDDVGLGNIDNTADANKPISTLTAAALAAKASSADLATANSNITTLETLTSGITKLSASGADPNRYSFSTVAYTAVVQQLNTLQDQAMVTYDLLKKALDAETIGAY